jgi:lysophospholipase L1-like esterase
VSGRLVALGDSFSCGEGVGVRTPLVDTWVGLLAACLQLDVDLLAVPGMKSAEVYRHQLHSALAAPADVVTVLVGLNDVIRSGFDAHATAVHVDALLDAVCAVHPVVLVVRLHDPTLVLPLPTRVQQHYRCRIRAVNAAIDAAVERHDAATCLDLDGIPALRERGSWAVDRLHPNRRGHRLIASGALIALAGRPPMCRDAAVLDVEYPEERVSRLDEARWLVRHGLPWLAMRLPKGAFSARRPNRDVRVGEPRERRGVPGPEQLVDR